MCKLVVLSSWPLSCRQRLPNGIKSFKNQVQKQIDVIDMHLLANSQHQNQLLNCNTGLYEKSY